ncbi:MAG: T9SS type A sorting domain-containing protein, partial [Ignavibacteria bacterium]
ARCTSPYVSTSPTFSYLPTKFFWYNNGGAYVRNLYSDIAYFYNSGDSLVVSFSGIPDSTKIFYAKCSGSGVVPATGTYQSGTESTSYKLYGRLSSNGNSNGSVISIFNQYSGSNRNVKYFRSSNFGDFSNPGQSTLWGSSVSSNYQPDIVGRRNANIHYFSFTTISSSDSVHYISVTNTGGTTNIHKMNSYAITSGTQGPKPGFRYINGDSCFVLYSESGPHNIWAATGCSGSITGIGNQNNIPYDYALNQNYPNPFNPTTSIQFSIPKNGLVKLVVYDMLGKEITTLVNEVKTAGIYIVDFNATNLSSGIYFYKITSGEFSSVKKMILVK